jgi:prepilin-type N-terminal cleavage/methylation domain-containing protein
MTASRRAGLAGFTLVEMMVAMVIGLAVLGASVSVAMASWQSVRGTSLRDGIDRRARFVGLSLGRDVQEVGVDLDSDPADGALVVAADTAIFLRVPYAPNAAPAYPLSLGNFANGQCGASCLEIVRDTSALQLAVGDLARIQAGSVRRLIVVTGVQPLSATVVRVRFGNLGTLLHQAGGLASLATGPGTFVQRLALVAYWRRGTQLMRAEQVDSSGALSGVVIADGVPAWTVRLVFTDGDTLAAASGTDADPTNDYNEIVGIRFESTLQADHTDPRVNNGALLAQPRKWYLVPRNLVYQRNRL